MGQQKGRGAGLDAIGLQLWIASCFPDVSCFPAKGRWFPILFRWITFGAISGWLDKLERIPSLPGFCRAPSGEISCSVGVQSDRVGTR